MVTLANRAKMTTATTGTGTITLASAVTGYQSFADAGITDGQTVRYTIEDGDNWEIGTGTYTASGTTLSRTVTESNNADAAINLSGLATVFLTAASEDLQHAANMDQGVATTDDLTFNDVTLTGTLTLSADPTASLQAATKQYVDTIAAAGLHYHDPVRVESPTALTATYNNGTAGVGATLTNAGTQAALVLDGVTVSTNDRVLIYTQTNAAQNGVYTVTNTGSASTNWVLTRSTDTDSYGASDPDALGQGDAFFVSEGSTGAGELYVMNTEGTITFGTTDITFAQVAATAVYSAGTGLTLNGTEFSTVQNISTASSPTFSGLTINGNIAVTGTVDGRDVAADGALAASAVQPGDNVSDLVNDAGYSTTTGTVTSVAMTVPTGFTITGSPITSSGTLAVAYSGGYQGYTSAESSKLAGIESGADVTDTANVTAAGALMDAELTNITAVKALNQGVATTDSPSFAGLTVDTNTLYVDSTNNRIGIGTASPSASLDVVGDAEINGDVNVPSGGAGTNNGIWFDGSRGMYYDYDLRGSYGLQFLSSPYPMTFVTNGDPFRWSVDGKATDAMWLSTSGNLGIGTTNPSATLDVVGNAEINGRIDATLDFSSRKPGTFWSTTSYFGVGTLGNLTTHGSYSTDLTSNGYRNSSGTWTGFASNGFTGAAQIQLRPTGAIYFGTEASKADGSSASVALRMTLNDTGLGIGTTSPSAKLDVVGATELNGDLDVLGLTRFASAGASDCYSQFNLGGASATPQVQLRSTSAGDFTVRTSASGAHAERVRVTSDGNLLVGTTTGSYRLQVQGGTALDGNVLIGQASSGFPIASGVTGAGFWSSTGRFQVNNSGDYSLGVGRMTSDGDAAAFFRDTTQVGSISVTSSATSYNTSSDYRLKDDIVPLSDAASRIMLLNPVNFAWKADGSRTDGFIAHEAQAVVPEAVTGEKDAVDAEGNPEYQGIDQSKLVPLLTAALQDALRRIEELEAKVN